MSDLFGSETTAETRKQYLSRIRKEERTKDGVYRKNPMIRIYGAYPDKKCKDCQFLCYKQFAKRYYKCRLRGCKGTISTDHHVNYDACGLYVEVNGLTEYKEVK